MKINPSLPLVSVKKRLLNRAEFAKEVGISVSEVRRRERQGYLSPVARGRRRAALYSSGQVKFFKDVLTGKVHDDSKLQLVKQLQSITYTAEEGTEVFELLRDGLTFDKIVLKTRIHPRSVQAIVHDYAAMVGGLVLSGNAISSINSLPLDANFPIEDEDQILKLLQAASTDGCSRCNKRPKNICLHCAPDVVDALDI